MCQNQIMMLDAQTLEMFYCLLKILQSAAKCWDSMDKMTLQKFCKFCKTERTFKFHNCRFNFLRTSITIRIKPLLSLISGHLQQIENCNFIKQIDCPTQAIRQLQ